MVPQQAVGKDLHFPTVVDFANGPKKGFAVFLPEKDLLPRAATVHDVIDGSGILNSKGPRHDYRHYHSGPSTVNKRFDPYPYREIVDSGQRPAGTIEGFDLYASAKLENNRKVSGAERASWTTTKNGSRLAVLETDFYEGGLRGNLFPGRRNRG